AALAPTAHQGSAIFTSPPGTRLPARGRRLVDGDAAGLDRDVAAGGEVAQDAVDHLARGADARRDVLLRQLLRDHQLAALLDRELEQDARHAPVDVEHRQAAHVL